MARTSLLIVLSFSALPAAAQLNDGTLSSAKGQECNDGPGARRATDCALVFDYTNLFQLQPDGTYLFQLQPDGAHRIRRIRPLSRPSERKEQR